MCSRKTIWPILLILASLTAAILFPRWWVGVIVIMVVCQAYDQIDWRISDKRDIQGAGLS